MNTYLLCVLCRLVEHGSWSLGNLNREQSECAMPLKDEKAISLISLVSSEDLHTRL